MASPENIERRTALRDLGALALRGVSAGILASGLAGCASWHEAFVWNRPPAPPKPPPNFTKEQIVAHLNDNIHKLRGWQSSNVSFKTRQKGGFPIQLSATVAVESPRNLRIRAKSFRGSEADFGSNDERFWVWIRESPQQVVFTAKHEEVDRVQTRMHLPFDPDWLMEALGVVPIDPSLVALERNDPRGEVVDLFEERILANGQRVKLATTVDVRRGLIVGRTLYDPQGDIVARASITKHRVHNHDQPHGGIVLPHEVKLEWPTVHTTMSMSIGQIEVNPVEIAPLTWQIPKIKGCPICEMSEMRTAEGPPRGVRDQPFRPVSHVREDDGPGFEFEN